MLAKRFGSGQCPAVMILALLLVGSSSATPQLDAVNDVGANATTRELRPSNFWAQSFTVSKDGLLSQVDVQVGKFAGATGDVTFELRPLVGGAPTIDDRSRLFAGAISINNIPVINSLADPAPFVSVDVSGAGLHVKPGETYAISLRRSGGTPAAAWRSKTNTYAGGTGFFRSLLTSPWSTRTDDLGFQTWIDSAPTAPYKLRVDPAYDVQYRPGTVSSLIEGEASLVVGGFPGDQTFPEQRPLMEFPITGLPAGAIIQEAHVEFDFYVSSGAPRIEITGFAGDGIASFPDATATGAIIATTGPTSASSPGEVPVDMNYVSSLVGQASHLGVRMRSLDVPEYVGFNTLESHSSLTPPRLVIAYTLPQQMAGDYNDDGAVNAADYVVWRKALGTTYSATHFNTWRANFGQGAAAGSGLSEIIERDAVPEPTTGIMLIAAAAAACACRRERCR
jgi:hypothetical protein